MRRWLLVTADITADITIANTVTDAHTGRGVIIRRHSGGRGIPRKQSFRAPRSERQNGDDGDMDEH